jgi:hypothetical protein
VELLLEPLAIRVGSGSKCSSALRENNIIWKYEWENKLWKNEFIYSLGQNC